MPGIDFNVGESWDERREISRISGKIAATRNITQSSSVKSNRTPRL
jgi:arginine decarboxylase